MNPLLTPKRNLHSVEVPPPAEDNCETQEPPRALLFSGLHQGHVTLGKNGYYYAMGTTDCGQNYVDLGYDPTEDSSWFEEMLRPLEQEEVPPTTPCKAPTGGL